MPSDKASKRNQALAKRVAKLRREDIPLRAVAEICQIHKGRVLSLQKLGERLLSLEEE